MGLPAKLTDEEQALLDKYAFLKKKRKELQQKQAATHIDTTKAALVVKKDGKESHRAPSDAKELAKRKILSGELKIKKDNSHREFKRARSHLDKKPENEKPVSKYETGDTDKKQDSEKPVIRPSGKRYHESFVPAGTLRDSSDNPEQIRPRFGDKNRKKIFVSGFGLTENILQNSFKKFGTILNVHPELERGQGFVTFASHEAANKAITEMHGEMVQSITLKVCMAGRPRGDNFGDRRSFEDRRERLQMPRFISQDAPPPVEKSQQPDSKINHNRELIEYTDEFDF